MAKMKATKCYHRLENEQLRIKLADSGRQSSPQTVGTTIDRPWWHVSVVVTCPFCYFFLELLGPWCQPWFIRVGCLRASFAAFFDPLCLKNLHSTHITWVTKSNSTKTLKPSETKRNSRNRVINHIIKRLISQNNSQTLIKSMQYVIQHSPMLEPLFILKQTLTKSNKGRSIYDSKT